MIDRFSIAIIDPFIHSCTTPLLAEVSFVWCTIATPLLAEVSFVWCTIATPLLAEVSFCVVYHVII